MDISYTLLVKSYLGMISVRALELYTYIVFQKKPMLKGCIKLNKIKCVEIVCCDVAIPCSYKYPFQVSLKNGEKKIHANNVSVW